MRFLRANPEMAMEQKGRKCVSRLSPIAPTGLSDNYKRLAMACQRPAALLFTANTLHIFTIFAKMASRTRTTAACQILRRQNFQCPSFDLKRPGAWAHEDHAWEESERYVVMKGTAAKFGQRCAMEEDGRTLREKAKAIRQRGVVGRTLV